MRNVKGIRVTVAASSTASATLLEGAEVEKRTARALIVDSNASCKVTVYHEQTKIIEDVYADLIYAKEGIKDLDWVLGPGEKLTIEVTNDSTSSVDLDVMLEYDAEPSK